MSERKRHGHRKPKRNGWTDTLKNKHVGYRELYAEPKKFYKGCVGKRSYPSKGKAMAIRQKMLNNSTSLEHYYDVEKLEAYKCDLCGKWHLGHGSPRGKAKAAGGSA